MSEDHASVTATDDHAAPDEHGDGHGSELAEPLGPVDIVAWSYAIGGGLVGLLVALALLAARGG